MAQQNHNAGDMNQLPFTLSKKGSYLEFYPKQILNETKAEKAESKPVFRMYLWDRDEVNRLYEMTQENVDYIIDEPPVLARFFHSILAAIYRKLII